MKTYYKLDHYYYNDDEIDDDSDTFDYLAVDPVDDNDDEMFLRSELARVESLVVNKWFWYI